jgi:hypothetical protein
MGELGLKEMSYIPVPEFQIQLLNIVWLVISYQIWQSFTFSGVMLPNLP